MLCEACNEAYNEAYNEAGGEYMCYPVADFSLIYQRHYAHVRLFLRRTVDEKNEIFPHPDRDISFSGHVDIATVQLNVSNAYANQYENKKLIFSMLWEGHLYPLSGGCSFRSIPWGRYWDM